MIGSIISPGVPRDGPPGLRTEASAPSSSASTGLNDRQTKALLPGELEPVQTSPNSARQQQDVNGQGQETSRLADQLRQAAERANRYFKQVNTQLEFDVGEDTGRIVIKVINSDTKEIVRQIPPEQLQKLDGITSKMRGLLFDAKG